MLKKYKKQYKKGWLKKISIYNNIQLINTQLMCVLYRQSQIKINYFYFYFYKLCTNFSSKLSKRQRQFRYAEFPAKKRLNREDYSRQICFHLELFLAIFLVLFVCLERVTFEKLSSINKYIMKSIYNLHRQSCIKHYLQKQIG